MTDFGPETVGQIRPIESRRGIDQRLKHAEAGQTLAAGMQYSAPGPGAVAHYNAIQVMHIVG